MSYFLAGNKKFFLKERTYIMGILNITPDSFSDGGRFYTVTQAINRALKIQEEGADILDIGGQSTKPGHKIISAKEEWSRLEPVCKILAKYISLPISIDTFYPYVAERAISLGAVIINDVTGFKEKSMIHLAAKTDASCVIMCDLSLSQVLPFLRKKREELLQKGVPPEKICLDPGIGFGKTQKENLQILRNPSRYSPIGSAILIGASRKRITNITQDLPPKERLAATLAAHTFAIAGGANIIRVHEVRHSLLASRLADKILKERDIN